MSTEQFDRRYRLNPLHVDNPRLHKRARFIVDQQRELQAGLSSRPTNIAFFENLLCDLPVPPGAPLVGYFCNMVPQEIIHALGARAVRLGCGNAALVQSGEEALAGEICPLTKSSFGAFMDKESIANRCNALVMVASCDAKRKLAEVLADYVPTFIINLPPDQDARRYGSALAAELERMCDFLCDRLGAKLTTRALLAAIEAGQRRTALVRRLQKARADKPAALSIRDAYLVIQAAFTPVDPEEWLAQAQRVLEEVEGFAPTRKRLRHRMVLTGAPLIWPNFKMLNLIEESGADVVADTLCTGFQSLYDPVVTDEKGRRALMRALAQRYVFASACPCFISQATRISRVLELVEEFRADGVINYGLRLCQLFDMEAYRLSQVLRARGIPFANIRTDYSLEDTEQLRVRLEAFLETVGEQA